MGKPIKQSEAESMARSALGPNMMSYSDVATLLGLAVRTVKRMTAEGTLPPPDLRLRRLVRWRPATIERWIDQHSPRGSRGGGR